MRRGPAALIVVFPGNNEDRHIITAQEHGKKNEGGRRQIAYADDVPREQSSGQDGKYDEESRQRMDIESRPEKAVMKKYDPPVVAIRDAARIRLTRSRYFPRGHVGIPLTSMKGNAEMRK